MPQEGVTKFHAEHRTAALDSRRHHETGCRLIAWREILALTGLVGRDPKRYGGAAYGNASLRVGPPSRGRGRRAFLITGTQTSGRRRLGLGDLALVERYDFRRNQVWSVGLVPPSSESMTHGALYDAGPHIRCVLHAHSPSLWRAARRLRLAVTDPGVEYGSPAMAEEMQRLYARGGLAEKGILAMGGHRDGVVVFGRSPREAGTTLLTWLARAYEGECSESCSLSTSSQATT